jgi:flagellar motor switch protein FliN/FliY
MVQAKFAGWRPDNERKRTPRRPAMRAVHGTSAIVERSPSTMANFGPEIAADVVAACQAKAAAAGQALSRALGAVLTVAPGESAAFDADALPAAWAEPGLVLVCTVGQAAAAVFIPAQGNLLPGWCANPDATAQSRLATLALELGANLLPEDFKPADCRAAWVASISEAARVGGLEKGAGVVPLSIGGGPENAAMWLAWPVARPDNIPAAGPPEESVPAASAAHAGDAGSPLEPAGDPLGTISTPFGPIRLSGLSFDQALPHLPQYARSLLKIAVPVVVSLASKKQTVASILELGPGSIIQFDKPCDDTLDLEISNQPVATGEAVKVGDKFGLRITSMILPGERFHSVHPKPNNARNEA